MSRYVLFASVLFATAASTGLGCDFCKAASNPPKGGSSSAPVTSTTQAKAGSGSSGQGGSGGGYRVLKTSGGTSQGLSDKFFDSVGKQTPNPNWTSAIE